MLSASITDLERKATFLHALCEGADVIFSAIKCETSPASNSMVAMLETITAKADELLGMIGDMEVAARPQFGA